MGRSRLGYSIVNNYPECQQPRSLASKVIQLSTLEHNHSPQVGFIGGDASLGSINSEVGQTSTQTVDSRGKQALSVDSPQSPQVYSAVHQKTCSLFGHRPMYYIPFSLGATPRLRYGSIQTRPLQSVGVISPRTDYKVTGCGRDTMRVTSMP